MYEISKVFCIGLPRTATSSLAEALKAHKVSTVHFPFALYEKGIDAPVVSSYTAFVDTPVPLLYQDLDRHWSNAKFILTVRDKSSWLESMKWLREEGGKIWQRRPAYDVYNRDFFGTAEFDKERLSAVYDDYHADVNSYFEGREQDLLTLDVTESVNTRPLVDFLGIDDESIPWPRTNEAREPTVLQSLAYQFESRQYMKIGTFLRQIDTGLQRRLGDEE
jgi:hypothetical protein